MSKFDELKKLAEAATPGVWDIFDPKSDFHTYGVTAKNGHAVVYFGGDQEEGIRRKEDADFIAAANPAAILELLAGRTQLVEALKKLTERAMGFNVSGVYFGEMTEDRVILDNACDALSAAGAQP